MLSCLKYNCTIINGLCVQNMIMSCLWCRCTFPLCPLTLSCLWYRFTFLLCYICCVDAPLHSYMSAVQTTCPHCYVCGAGAPFYCVSTGSCLLCRCTLLPCGILGADVLCTMWHLWCIYVFLPCGISGADAPFYLLVPVVQMCLSTLWYLWCRCAFLLCGVCGVDVPFYFVVSVVQICLSTLWCL